jgi:hypothetical protein
VDFVHISGNASYPVSAGSSSIIADEIEVSAAEAYIDRYWNDWNAERDKEWRQHIWNNNSKRYLPDNLGYDAYALDGNGVWERVHYNRNYYFFWRPTTVASGWAPFTVGRWVLGMETNAGCLPSHSGI